MSNKPIKSFSEVAAELYTSKSVQFVANWKHMIPRWSRWHPGDPGNPECRTCEGTGYLRLDVPVGHPYFGALVLCDCARRFKKSAVLQSAENAALKTEKLEGEQARVETFRPRQVDAFERDRAAAFETGEELK